MKKGHGDKALLAASFEEKVDVLAGLRVGLKAKKFVLPNTLEKQLCELEGKK